MAEIGQMLLLQKEDENMKFKEKSGIRLAQPLPLPFFPKRFAKTSEVFVFVAYKNTIRTH